MTAPITRRTVAALDALAAVCLAPLLAACGGPSEAAAPPACRQPPPAELPHTAGTLTEADSGAICLKTGEQIAVFLHGGTAPGDKWTDVATSSDGVLQPRSSGVLTAPVGVTPAIFAAGVPGTGELTSTRAGRTWHVTVVVAK